MKIKSIAKSMAFGATLLMAVGCATGPLTAVKESSKDTTGRYDGNWTAQITNTPPLQQSSGNVSYMHCGDRSGQTVGRISVKDGEVEYRHRGQPFKTYVNKKGGFKLVIYTNKGGFSGGNDTFVAKKNPVTVSGSLQTGKGTHMTSSSDLGGAGCKSSVAFKKR